MFGRVIVAHRLRCGLSQELLAEMAGLSTRGARTTRIRPSSRRGRRSFCSRRLVTSAGVEILDHLADVYRAAGRDADARATVHGRRRAFRPTGPNHLRRSSAAAILCLLPIR
jgi:hypothetical protein